MVWPILFVLCVLILALHWRRRNAVWGAATLGLVIGVVVAVIQPGFDWWTVGKAVVIATVIGAILEWAPRLISTPRP